MVVGAWVPQRLGDMSCEVRTVSERVRVVRRRRNPGVPLGVRRVCKVPEYAYRVEVADFAGWVTVRQTYYLTDAMSSARFWAHERDEGTGR